MGNLVGAFIRAFVFINVIADNHANLPIYLDGSNCLSMASILSAIS